ncbi:MAG TPA: ribonucleotide-diphosphate reductase subunit beta [Saprospiraceae bacterium]|nr:ribonucleotide-diphosphate reductase subunit beta [Saprospiraceae bacterium]
MKGDLTRFAFFPINNPLIIEYYHQQKNLFWVPSEIDYSNDRTSWDQLDTDTQDYTKFLLFLFAQLDGIVNENLAKNFIEETSFAKECSNFYTMQAAIETIHNETYSNLIKAFIRDPEEQLRGLNSIANYPTIKKIAEWAFDYMDPSRNLLERVVAFCCIEGIIFSSAFAGIYWLKRRNVLPGLCKANEWIARDEAIHTRFGVALYHHMAFIWQKMSPLSQETIHNIIRSAVDVTSEFTRTSMNCELVGLDAEDMITYVEATADSLSKSLGYNAIYKSKNRLDWMVVIALPNKSNFFETKVSEYAREDGDGEFVFDLDIAF